MTQDDINARVWSALDEGAAATSLRYTEALLSEMTLDGVRYYVAKTGCQYDTETIIADAYTLFYDLPCDCIQVERVEWSSDGTLYPVTPTLARELDAEQWRWQRSTDTRARAYFLLGLRQIALWPVSADGGETYIVHYQKDVPDEISAVPIEDHEALFSYTLARCLLRERKARDGAREYAKFAAAVKAGTRRRSSPDATHSIQGGW